MKIAILLPYKENYSKIDTGAVSIFINGVNKLSKFKNDINIYGSTEFKSLSKNYQNLIFKKKFLQSSSKIYIKNFLKKIEKKKIDILEIHNRPHYLNYIKNLNYTKKILFFHNNPLEMHGSFTENDRINLYNKADKIIFNSDREQLGRVFLNLIKNSIESIQEKSEKVSNINKNIAIELNDNNNHISLIINDTGVGFKNLSKNVKDILNPYFTTKQKGTGLGLSIVNKIINDHSGNIKFTSIDDGAEIKVIFRK